MKVAKDFGLIERWKGCKEHIDVWCQRIFEVPEESSELSQVKLDSPAPWSNRYG